VASALLAAALVGACSPAPQAPGPTPSPSATPWVYAAIGASETVGVGTRDSVREAFPQRLLQLLGPAAVLYNFGIPSETTAAALEAELPAALAVHPTLATVWLNVDDLLAGVPVAAYESRLDQLVRGLTDAHAVVLLANTPQLDRLPAYAACRPNPPPGSIKCPLTGVSLPPPDQVQAQVRAYNAAIAEVAARRGARLVDLAAAGQVPDQHPEYVSRDGFHPSAQGAAAIAEAFAEALGVIRPSPSPSSR
jgi:lysophospholipase L1-like esterase